MSRQIVATTEDVLEAGGIVFVASWRDVGPNAAQRRVFGGAPRDRGYTASLTRHETNLGHRPLLHGWLGTTNDISRTAIGIGVVMEGWSDEYEPMARIRMARTDSPTERKLLAEVDA